MRNNTWLRFIRQKAGGRVHFWPFDGWEIPPGRSVIAELYPSLWSRGFPREERTSDQHDAYSVAAWTRQADIDGSLTEFFETKQFERAEALARALVPWLESAGGAVDAETRARLLIAYAGIAFERREYPKARALSERIVTADEFNETRAKEDDELKIAEVDLLTKQYDKAFEELDKLTRPKDKMVQTEAFLQLARLKYEQEEYTDARNFPNQVLQRMPDHAEGRILEGSLDLKMKRLIEATEVKVGFTTSQRIIVPGKPLKVRLEDQNLAVVGKADSIEIRAWTDSGDEEIFNLVPFCDSKRSSRVRCRISSSANLDCRVWEMGRAFPHWLVRASASP